MLKKLALGLASLGAMASGTYLLFIRPWHLRYGATDEEVRQAMPDDELIPPPWVVATHAITINTSIRAIWPWLVQLGWGRGGFYSYGWLAQRMGLEITKVGRLLPEFQQVQAGDSIVLGPQGPVVPVSAVVPEQVLVLGGPDPTMGGASWVFLLKPLDEEHTRLVVRMQADCKMPVLVTPLVHFLLEPVHFTMERKMLLTIKRLAEQTIPSQEGPKPVYV
jgi:hypothetical protein